MQRRTSLRSSGGDVDAERALTADYVDEEDGAQDRGDRLDHAEDGGGKKFLLQRNGFGKHVSVESEYEKVGGEPIFWPFVPRRAKKSGA
jgi:hypothetical protein